MITPEHFGIARCEKKDLEGGSAQENAEDTKAILAGKMHGPKRDAVLMNAGAGFYITGKAESMEAGIKRATEILDSGKGLEVLEKFVALSQE